MKPISLFSFVIPGLTLLLFVNGCAAPNSNGRRYSETTSIHLISLESTNQSPKALVASTVAIEAAIAVAKWAIQQEAKRYTAVSQASLLTARGFHSDQPTLLAIVRTFEAAAPYQTRLSDATKDIRSVASERVEAAGYRPKKNALEDFVTSVTNLHSSNAKVSLVALLLVHAWPSTEGTDFDPAMNVTLLGSAYPVLMAKASCLNFFFGKPQSTLDVTLEAPRGIAGADYKVHRIVGPQRLRWSPGKSHGLKWEPGTPVSLPDLLHAAPGIRSVPYQFPEGPVEITATIIESSDVKKALENLGDQVGKLKPGDLKF